MSPKTFRHVLTPHTSQRIADLAQCDVGLHTLNKQRHQILGAFRDIHQLAKQLRYYPLISTPSQLEIRKEDELTARIKFYSGDSSLFKAQRKSTC